MPKHGPQPRYRLKRSEVIQPQDPSYRLIPLTQGRVAIVDSADFKWLNQWNWHAHWDPSTLSFYAKKKKNISMHRLILGCEIGEDGDHRNHDTLDNRRRNLRKATKSQNAMNRKTRRDSSTGFRGVVKRKTRFEVYIGVKGKRHYMGSRPTAREAAALYNEAAPKYHGEFARLNTLSDC